MTFSDVVNGAINSFRPSVAGTSGPSYSAPAPQQRFFGMSGAGAGVTLGGAIAVYAIGRYFGVIPKLI